MTAKGRVVIMLSHDMQQAIRDRLNPDDEDDTFPRFIRKAIGAALLGNGNGAEHPQVVPQQSANKPPTAAPTNGETMPRRSARDAARQEQLDQIPDFLRNGYQK